MQPGSSLTRCRTTARSKTLAIGFTRMTARNFFGRLSEAGVRKVIDVRLHNTSQLAGFAKRMISRISWIRSAAWNTCMRHCSRRPTAYKKRRGDWAHMKAASVR